MLVFITSVRHPENAKSYHRVWRLLNATLISVCNQTDENFRVIVVCNKILPLEKNVEKIQKYTEFIIVDFPPVSQIGIDGIRSDRGTKYLIGVIAAEKYQPNHVMFFDADDLIGNDIAEYVNARPDANGFFIGRGYAFWHAHLIAFNGMHIICGSGNILRFDFVCEKIPAGLNLQSSKPTIIETIDKFFLLIILGDHPETLAYFAKAGKPLERLPGRAVVWVLDTGENHSYFRNPTDFDPLPEVLVVDKIAVGGLSGSPITPCDVAYFSLPQKRTRLRDRIFYRYHRFCRQHPQALICGLKKNNFQKNRA